jgi:hypothetical protein
VALVRFALEQQPVLAPFADTVRERFAEWLKRRSGVPPLETRRDGASTFTPE